MLSGRAILPVSRATAWRTATGSRLIVPLGVRTYAQAAVAVDSKPPIALFGLDGTYASALVCDRFQAKGMIRSTSLCSRLSWINNDVGTVYGRRQDFSAREHCQIAGRLV